MKLYECVTKITAKGANIAFQSPEDNLTFLRMMDISKCIGTGRK